METVRAINAGKTSRRPRKTGAPAQQSASTAKNGSGFKFTLSDTAAETRGGGEGTSQSQEGNPGAGMYRTVIIWRIRKCKLLTPIWWKKDKHMYIVQKNPPVSKDVDWNLLYEEPCADFEILHSVVSMGSQRVTSEITKCHACFVKSVLIFRVQFKWDYFLILCVTFGYLFDIFGW